MKAMSGSKRAEQLLTQPQGATMSEIIQATGGPQYNVLKKLHARGYTIRKVKEGASTRYFASAPDSLSIDATIGENGQVTVPREVRERLGLHGRGTVTFTVSEGDGAVMAPAYRPLSDLAGVLPKPKRHMTIDEMDEAIREAAADRDRRAGE
jgi:antitoxin PrlF